MQFFGVDEISQEVLQVKAAHFIYIGEEVFEGEQDVSMIVLTIGTLHYEIECIKYGQFSIFRSQAPKQS